MVEYKKQKVLVVSNNAFSKVLNNGKTYESLFSGFPKNTIAQLFFNHNEIPDFDFCDNYFKITDTDVLKNIFSFKRRYGEKCYSNESFDNKDYSKIENPLDSFQTNTSFFLFLKSQARRLSLFRDYLWKLGSWKTAKLFSWIEEFNPTVIFLIVGSPGYPQDVVDFLIRKYNLPLIIYFTDDYIINPLPGNFLDRVRQNKMKKTYSRTVNSASICFAIGNTMCDVYSKYFGREFIPIMNSVEIIPYVEKDSNSSSIKISYFGGLHLNRWKMISKLGMLLMQLKEVENVDYEFSVYTVSELTNEIDNSFKKSNVTYKGFVSGSKFDSLLRDSDVLLHVESDENIYRRLTSLSVSTKLPEYLITGNIVIAYGPIEVASLKLISDNEIGVVISSEELDEEIMAKLKYILSNEELRLTIGKQGYDYAKNNFDIKKNQDKFMKLIYSV